MKGLTNGLGSAPNIPPTDNDTRFMNEADAFSALLRLTGLDLRIYKDERTWHFYTNDGLSLEWFTHSGGHALHIRGAEDRVTIVREKIESFFIQESGPAITFPEHTLTRKHFAALGYDMTENAYVSNGKWPLVSFTTSIGDVGMLFNVHTNFWDAHPCVEEIMRMVECRRHRELRTFVIGECHAISHDSSDSDLPHSPTCNIWLIRLSHELYLFDEFKCAVYDDYWKMDEER